MVKALPVRSLAGRFNGRCNLLLSGPSVNSLEDPRRIGNHDWIGVNGSPSLFAEDIPRMRIYHVNDSTYLGSSLDAFLRFAGAAEYTVIDYRGMFELLRLVPEDLPSTKFVVYDSWAYPLRLPLGKIQSLVDAPSHKGLYISPDLSLGLPTGGTVAYTAGQIAWRSGYDALYIYGLDMTNSGRFYRESNQQPQMLDKSFEKVIRPSFELLAGESSRTGFRIFNCNPESRLPADVIPHLNAEESLQGN